MNRFSSRKFHIAIVGLAVCCTLPILYKSLGITDDITLKAMTYIFGLVIGYGGLNLLGKKLGEP